MTTRREMIVAAGLGGATLLAAARREAFGAGDGATDPAAARALLDRYVDQIDSGQLIRAASDSLRKAVNDQGALPMMTMPIQLVPAPSGNPDSLIPRVRMQAVTPEPQLVTTGRDPSTPAIRIARRDDAVHEYRERSVWRDGQEVGAFVAERAGASVIEAGDEDVACLMLPVRAVDNRSSVRRDREAAIPEAPGRKDHILEQRNRSVLACSQVQ